MSAKVLIAGALLGVAPLVAASSATIQNNCPFEMYVWNIDSPAFPTGPTAILAPKGQSGSSWSSPYTTNPDGGGVSIKVATCESDLTGGPVQQFEYTLTGDKIWYDISNINGNPLMTHGSSLLPSSEDAANYCLNLSCPAGQTVCGQAYNTPKEDIQTHNCAATTGLTAYLCGEDGSSAPSSNAPAVSAPSSSAPVVAAPPSSAPVVAAPSSAAPAPVVTSSVQAQSWSAAPSVTEAASQPGVAIVQMTTFATVTATAAPAPLQLGPDGAAYVVPNRKRHLHEHANAHHHIH